MQAIFDPVNLVLAGLAVFIFWRLRSVLGTRTGNERSAKDIFFPESKTADVAVRTDEKPPGQRVDQPAAVKRPVWTDVAPEGSSLALNLEEIRKADGSFDPKAFLAGAKIAYEMIVEAFAKGDKAALKKLLSPEVMEGFSAAIDQRAKDGHKLDFRFIGFEKAEIKNASLVGKIASVDMRFATQIISATQDKTGALIEGDLNAVRDVVDLWTFERDTAQKDPNWRVVATENLD